jgi:chorismate mutase
MVKDHVKEAAEAHTNLNVFASVVSILEGGHLYGATNDRAAQRIIELCKAEQAKCLVRYDRAREAATKSGLQ